MRRRPDGAALLVGAFRDEQVRRALALPPEETPLALMPVGRPAE